MRNYKELLPDITTFIFDYDGVLTNGVMVLNTSGEPFRTANVKDGYALQLAVKQGYNVAIITGGRSETVVSRAKTLGIHDVFIGVGNKISVYDKYLNDNNIKPEQVLYMGDDIPDMNPMKASGLATCPADSSEEIKQISNYISPRLGGEGCVRDVIEQVMKVQGKWMDDKAHAW